MSSETESRPRFATEKAQDLAWVAWNRFLFDPLAREGYVRQGRGAIVVNLCQWVTRAGGEVGHPFNYYAAQDSSWTDPAQLWSLQRTGRIQMLLRDYHPKTEWVLGLLKPTHAVSYRLPLPAPHERDREIRGTCLNAEMEERRQRLRTDDPTRPEFTLTTPYTPEWYRRPPRRISVAAWRRMTPRPR